MSPPEDVFERIEAHVVAIGERLEESRRYRSLAAEAERLYAASSRVARRVREAARKSDAEGTAAAARLEEEMEALATRARGMLDALTTSAAYRELLSALGRDDGPTAARLISEVFEGVEPARPSGPLYLPLSPKRGEPLLDPSIAAERIAGMTREGIEPQHAPGPGADANVQPIRFYEELAGLDSPILVVVHGEDLPEPAFRASALGEMLIYRRRIHVPLTAGLRKESPDDWLEVRAGGYESYRSRCREQITERGIVVTEL